MIAELCVRNIDELILVEALTVWVDSATQMYYIVSWKEKKGMKL